jgi:hypothetical protein
MRRVKSMMVLPIVTLLALVTPVAAAHATTGAAAPAQAAAFTCYPNTPSSFTVSNSTVVDNQTTTTIPDGTPIPGGFVAQSDPPNFPSKTTGSDVASLTNEATGHTILNNEGGTSWFTFDPTPKMPGALATGTFVSTGTTSELFGPKSLAALAAAGIHEPAVVLVNGLLVMHFAVDQEGPFVTSFSINGTQQDGCALLAGS